MSANRSTGTTDRYTPGSFQDDIVDGEIIGDVIISPDSREPQRIDPVRSDEAKRRRLAGWRIPRPPFYLTTFILFVVIPSVAAQIYLLFIASDQYQASTRFAVRSAVEQSESSSTSAAVSNPLAQVSVAGQDAQIVVAYIRSRAIVDDLEKKIDVRGIFSRPEGDFWARLKKNARAEELADYWKNMVTVNLDGPSGIVTLYVRAFRPKDALDLTRAITGACETLINDVSQRARQDSLGRAEAEMRRSEAMVRDALANLRVFRDKVGVLDPIATATMTSKLITEAMAEKIKLENELFVGQKAMSAEAPSLAGLKTRLDAVNDQIDRLKTKLTSSSKNDTPLSQSLVQFEELELKRVFSEKMYSLSQDALERARTKAERQNVYVDVFVPAGLPEEARYPERISLSLIIPIALLIIWGIMSLLVSTVEDHRN